MNKKEKIYKTERGKNIAASLEKFWASPRSDETCKIMSEKAKERCARGEHPRKGAKLTDEHKKIIGNANKNRIISVEYRKKISESLKGRVFTDEHRAKIGAKHKGKIVSEKTRELLRKTHLGKKNTPEQIEKQRQKIMGENNPSWIKDRELAAKNGVIARVMGNLLSLHFKHGVSSGVLIEEVGYNRQQFFKHFENRFYRNIELGEMLWQNHGSNNEYWQIHHNIPILWFVKEEITDPKIINALDNLQPLWGEDYVARHRELRKFTKEQRKFWVELFTYYIKSKECHIIRTPVDIVYDVNFTYMFNAPSVSIPVYRLVR